MAPPRPLPEDVVTHRQLTGWVIAAVVGLLALALTFGNLVVTKAEAASEKVETRIDRRLGSIESKVDKLLERGSQ